MAKAGINGLALTAVAGGIVLVWSGIHNATVADTLRGFIKGNPAQGTPAKTPLSSALADAEAQIKALADAATTPLPLDAGSVATGDIVTDARQYLGVKYTWAKSDPHGAGVDCSGLVNWVCGHDLRLPIPGSPSGIYSGHGPVTTQWYAWSGLTTVPKDQAKPGDLVCWISHIGIYIGGGQMIDAPSSGDVVKVQNVWNTPAPIYRRYPSGTTDKNGPYADPRGGGYRPLGSK